MIRAEVVVLQPPSYKDRLSKFETDSEPQNFNLDIKLKSLKTLTSQA